MIETETQLLVKTLYKTAAGEPLEMTPLQDEIFVSIANKESARVHMVCHTRFGKSLIVALAVLTRAATFPEKWAIIAGTEKKAAIIMDYVISHIFDNDYTKSRFLPDKGESVESIRRYKNKKRLTFKVGVKIDPDTGIEVPLYGEITIGSAKDALGFGAENIVEDEAALIPDNEHALVMRMLGDNPHNNFMCKIGNPFTRGHFLESYRDPAYKKVIVTCYQSLEEAKSLPAGKGRMTQQIIDENKNRPYFKVLYECMYPSASEVDESGWSFLLNDNDVDNAEKRASLVKPYGAPKLGVDIARGGRNYNAWVIRYPNFAKVIKKDLDDNLISIGDTTINLMSEYHIPEEDVFVDDSGVGGGVTDYLSSLSIEINPINFGSSPIDEPEVANVRAQVYAGKEGAQVWLRNGGAVEPHKDWIELTKIRFKKNNSGRTILESKEDMRKRGVESPDVADAFALTFAYPTKKPYYGNNETLNAAGSQFGGVGNLVPGIPG